MEWSIILKILIISAVKFCTGNDGVGDFYHDSIYVQPQQVHLSIEGKQNPIFL